MGANDYWISNLPMEDYLRDLGRTAGSVLSMVDKEPERYGAHLEGKDVDRPSAAKAQGSLVHFRAAEDGGSEEMRRRFAFYPSRADAMVPETKIKEGTKTVKIPTGRMVPQDGSEAGKRKSLDKGSNVGKQLHRDFMDAHRGKTIVYPESQPLVNAMVRAVKAHPAAARLLEDPDFEPEVTGHFTCPETGEQYRIRPDGLIRSKRIAVELKTVTMKGEARLETDDPSWVGARARDGWARKDAMIHDGCKVIDGHWYEVHWIVVEAREDGPRVSVVESRADQVGSFYDLGREGQSDWRIRGYLELTRKAQALRSSHDFRAQCVIEPVQGWSLPRGLLGAMEFDTNARGIEAPANAPDLPVIGGVPLEDYAG